MRFCETARMRGAQPRSMFAGGRRRAGYEAIYRYVAHYDAVGRADALLAELEAACRKLESLPERGNFPKELVPLDIQDFREIHDKPYRIIYMGRKVVVCRILDGRRDMQSLLQRRLIR